ncbi:MAG TPA: hypothetical protein VER11_33400 [Polyangiaceae bacterium]|nr:hypothetical protein [Polyangiaceae bacterium]
MHSPKTLRIVAQDRDHFVADWHDTVVSMFRGAPTLQHVLNMSNACKALLEQRPAQVTYLSVIERSSPAPTETVRRELAVWSRDVVTKLALAVIVAEGGGFKNAIVRGVGIALTVVLPHQVPFKFTSSVEEGATLLGPFLPADSGGAMALISAVAAGRELWEQSL